MKRLKKNICVFGVLMLTTLTVLGCGNSIEENNQEHLAENVIITETGEILEKEMQPTEEPEVEAEAVATAKPEIKEIEGELTMPEQEQTITEEDQVEPKGNELQIVFLGDSIFDNNRDGTGVPYLTSVQCEADVYNLAIGGTSASIEVDEQGESDRWTSRSLAGIVKAIKGEISTDIFEGTRTKEILDNPHIDFSNTDYFVIEYGLNDFFRAVPQSSSNGDFDLKTYAGALRYAVSNLKEIAADATIILCGPHYAQFYSGGRFIGDGNTLNTGHGTLFDYKGTCEYIAKEQQAEFFDAYMDLGIDGYTAEAYLEDGVHLTAEGRQLYADALAERILRIEKNKNN